MDLQQLATMVRDMRKAQDSWMRGRKTDLLAEAVRKEIAVDRAVAEILGGGQASLFPPETNAGGSKL